MLKIIGLLLSVFLVSLGIWGILNPHSAMIEVAEIQGSRVNPNSLFRSEQNVLGGGDFATFVPGAFVTVRFSRPYAFTRIRHVYPFTQYAFPWVQVKTADIQWSDDGSKWEVADAATAFGGTMDFQVAAAGAHRWWRLVVTGWAGLPDLLIGNIWFDPADAPFVLPYDVAWGLVFAGILGFLTAFSVLTTARAWALLGATAMAFVFNYAIRLSPYQIISMNDSPSYLQPLLFGSYDSLRSLGYPNLVRLVGITLGLNNLGNFQLLIQLLSFGVLSFVIWRCYGFLTAVLILAVGAVFFSGWMVFFAPQILIESMSTSALLLAAAGLIAVSRRPTTGGFVLAGIGLALATLAKSAGLALTIAAISIIRFLPRGQRTYGLMFMIVPALGLFADVCASLREDWTVRARGRRGE
jgi:hypothetical protein